jgi:hypothetical protein
VSRLPSAQTTTVSTPHNLALKIVQTSATDAEIKKAYYIKARHCHPDKRPDDESAIQEFQLLGEVWLTAAPCAKSRALLATFLLLEKAACALQIQSLVQAYQILSNEKLRQKYDAKQDVSGDTDLMASGDFFAMLFGSMRFEEFVGELMISSLAREGMEVDREQVRCNHEVCAHVLQKSLWKSLLIALVQLDKMQTARIDHVKSNLLKYLDTLYTDTDMFQMHIKNLAAQKLATAEYGPVMLVTLGKVYRLSAKQAQGNMVAYFK